MRAETFERLVAEALEELPREIQAKLDNVDVVVDEWADGVTLERARVGSPRELLGFYDGVPRTKRSQSYGLVLPDKITIYRGPIGLRSRTLEQARGIIRRVVRHEIAHHFGIDDARLRELEGCPGRLRA
jgi:predicted Zn-dependent protease with MMP-like domain